MTDDPKFILVQGAREHNLDNLTVRIPREKLVVLTGLSGSGKSSLAFDTIYAEGQRKYVESLSAYARQFLEQMQKPDVDHIEGLPPTISIEQRSGSANPRSTVATTTEIYDYLRLLFARVGEPFCYKCGKPIRQQTPGQIVDAVLALPEGKDLVRASIYELLEDDGRPDCDALLRCHDRDKPLVEQGVESLIRLEASDFCLDDPNARRVRTLRAQTIRDRALRRAVLPAYEYACALCSTRIIWNNRFEAEAAHIKPRSLKGVDDPRNAISLCQTHHWAFELGLWSADDRLHVLVGAPVEPRGDDLASLRGFAGAALRAPARASARPHPDALRWHRENRFDRAA